MENLDDSQSDQSKMTENEANTKETTEHSTVTPPVEVMPSLEDLLKKEGRLRKYTKTSSS
jgi:hypothetical protein